MQTEETALFPPTSVRSAKPYTSWLQLPSVSYSHHHGCMISRHNLATANSLQSVSNPGEMGYEQDKVKEWILAM